jgi:N,N'-diacetyllegionaminate synthase
MKTIIIAEAGVNHNGDMQIARKMIDVAAAAGVDIIKFQTFTAEKLVTRNADKAEYQKKSCMHEESHFDMIRRLELTRQQHESLIAHCRERKIQFLSTGFDQDSLDMLVELGVNIIKVPSGEITNYPYLRHVGKLKKEVVLSTGMATISEVESALNVLEKSGTTRDMITVLHCTTEYPTQMEDVNLLAMQTIGKTFGVQTGYSDHTQGIEVAIAATALGAFVIEKHFTLDRNLPGPDHKASIEPDELRYMVSAIRNIEKAMGNGVKRPSATEEKNKLVARKSLVAAAPIFTGDIFTVSNLTVKRPGTGISPMYWENILGRKATRNYSIDELIEL